MLDYGDKEKAVMNSSIRKPQHILASMLYKNLAAMLLFSFAATANATAITGEIGFGGNFNAVYNTNDPCLTTSPDPTCTLDDAIGIDFDPNSTIINSTSGDFDSVDPTVTGTIKDFQFDPFVGAIADFWTAGSFSFELLSVTKDDQNSNSNFLTLVGTGIISSTVADLQDTNGTWIFTGDTVGGGTFSWSAGSAAVTLPATALIFIAGLGLMGFKQRLCRNQ